MLANMEMIGVNKNDTMASLRRLFAILRIARCYRTHLTADKREIKDFLKLPSATSFIRQPSYKRKNYQKIANDDLRTSVIFTPSTKKRIAFETV